MQPKLHEEYFGDFNFIWRYAYTRGVIMENLTRNKVKHIILPEGYMEEWTGFLTKLGDKLLTMMQAIKQKF